MKLYTSKITSQVGRQEESQSFVGPSGKRAFGVLKAIHATKVKSHGPILKIEMDTVGFARHRQPRSVSWLVLQRG